eukprot:scaffold26196_cov32-Tisochrysis_lutea.AAC.2
MPRQQSRLLEVTTSGAPAVAPISATAASSFWQTSPSCSSNSFVHSSTAAHKPRSVASAASTSDSPGSAACSAVPLAWSIAGEAAYSGTARSAAYPPYVLNSRCRLRRSASSILSSSA